MGAKGGGGGGTQTVTQQTKLPDWVDAAAQKNLNQAYNVSQAMPGPYGGPRYAGMTDGMAANIAGLQLQTGQTQPSYELAKSAAAGLMNYQPSNVESGAYAPTQIGATPQIGASFLSGMPNISASSIGNVPQIQQQQIGPPPQLMVDQINPANLSDANYTKYMNPFTQNVIDNSMRALEAQRLQSLNGIGDQAIRSKAFGGSRQGVLEGVTNAASAMNAGNLAAQLQSQNFQQAQNAAVGDITRNLAAQQANQATALSTGQTNLSALMQAQLANQQNALATGTANQNAVLQSSLANQAADLNAATNNQRTAMQGALANQAADMSAQSANQAAMMQSALANQQAGNRAAEFNIGNNMQAQLANQQAGLQGAGFNLTAANALGQLTGQGQQAYLDSLRSALSGQGLVQADKQAQYDAARQAYIENQQFPLQQLQIPLQALGMTPYGQTQTTTGPAQPQAGGSGLMQGLGAASAGIGLLGGIGSMAAAPGQSALTGLMSLLPFAGSDENLKTDIKKVGKDEETGLDIYSYRYKGDPKTYPKVVGPMAQDIAKKYPDQVHEVGGKLAVNLGFGPMRKAFH